MIDPEAPKRRRKRRSKLETEHTRLEIQSLLLDPEDMRALKREQEKWKRPSYID